MRTLVALIALSLVLLSSPVAQAVPRYTIVPLGFDDVEHTRDDGFRHTIPEQLNEAGQVAGRASRFNGGSTSLGVNAWLYDGVTTKIVGLTGPEHTNGSNGYKETEFQRLNETGQVAGHSVRYNGSTEFGSSAWLYDGVTTINVGLTGPEHTRNDGRKESYASQLNEAGKVLGYAERYNGGSTFMGENVWLFDGVTTIELGLTGPMYTRDDGYRFSHSNHLNEAGQVAGNSYRYNGSTDSGSSAWLYHGATTTNIGLTDIEHTRNDGFRYSSTEHLNEAGQVAGYSRRYNGGSGDLGQNAWLYDGATTKIISLTGPEHTRNDGYTVSEPRQLNEAGQVIGDSGRYSGATELGQGAWLYDGAATIDIGLSDIAHTRDDSFRFSSPEQLNEVGQVVGYSLRYNGGNINLGLSAWRYDGATTIEIGLTGSEHTRSDGYRYSFPQGLNNAGQVWGISERFNGGSTNLGQDSWFYDPTLDQTFPLLAPISNSGHTSVSVRYLGDDGIVLGSYELYDAMDNYLGARAFYFTVADGLHILGSLVDGDLAAQGWEYLGTALNANHRRQIIGSGALSGSGNGFVSYLLTPIVPEPSAIVLVALTFIAPTMRIRRAG